MRTFYTKARSLTTICRHHLQAMVDKARDDDCIGVRIHYDTTLVHRVESIGRVPEANSPSGAHWNVEGTSVVFRVDVDLSALLADLRHTAKHNLAAQKENQRFWAVQQDHERAGADPVRSPIDLQEPSMKDADARPKEGDRFDGKKTELHGEAPICRERLDDWLDETFPASDPMSPGAAMHAQRRVLSTFPEPVRRCRESLGPPIVNIRVRGQPGQLHAAAADACAGGPAPCDVQRRHDRREPCRSGLLPSRALVDLFLGSDDKAESWLGAVMTELDDEAPTHPVD